MARGKKDLEETLNMMPIFKYLVWKQEHLYYEWSTVDSLLTLRKCFLAKLSENKWLWGSEILTTGGWEHMGIYQIQNW